MAERERSGETRSRRGATALAAAPEPRPLPPVPRTAWIEIDLDALVHNYALLRAALPPRVRLEPVVKGNAYGHGSVPVARALAAAGAPGFAVATFDEALELREAAIRGGILVLYPIPPGLVGEAIRRHVAITAGDRTLLDRTLAEARRAHHAAVAAGRRRLPRLSVHLEVETGLGRGGFLPSELADAQAAIERTEGVGLVTVWSHLQDAGDRSRSAAQADRLGLASGLLEEVGARPARHIAASGGVLAASTPEFEAVRIGLSLYGIVPDGLTVDAGRRSLAEGLRPILALRARPVRVTQLPAGTGISYGPSFVTSRESRIATLPLGYADGFPRSLSNRAEAIVRGRRVPLVGTVAMDAVMADVTDVAGPPVGVDDEFTLIGCQGDESIDAREVGRWGNTISYEIVTALSRRLPRVYYAAAETVGVPTLATDARWRTAARAAASESGPKAGRRQGEPETRIATGSRQPPRHVRAEP